MKWGALALGLLLFTGPTVAAAQPLYQVSLPFDGLLALGSGTVGLLLDREKFQWDGLSPCEGLARYPSAEERLAFELMAEGEGLCDEMVVPAFDRWVLDQGFESARTLSDIGASSMMLAPLVVGWADSAHRSDPWDRGAEATLVSIQTFGLTILLASAVKVAWRRPRPLTFRADFDKEDRYAGDARLSFFSGHSAVSFASASLVTVMLVERRGTGVGTILGASGAYLGASLVAYLRIAARKHFLSDVLVGAAVGTLIGILVPLVHLSPDAPGPTSPGAAPLRPDPGYHPLVTWGGAF